MRPQAPAWRLAGSGRPPLQSGPHLIASGGPDSSAPSKANTLLRVAQVVAGVQFALAAVTAVNLIRGDQSVSGVAPGVNLAQASRATVNNYAIATLVVAALIAVAGIAIGRRSTIARACLTLWSVVGFFVTLIAFYGGGSIFGAVTIVVVAAGGWALLPAAAVLGIEAALFYALAMHPATYHTFSQRGLARLVESPSSMPSGPLPLATRTRTLPTASALLPRKPRMAEPATANSTPLQASVSMSPLLASELTPPVLRASADARLAPTVESTSPLAAPPNAPLPMTKPPAGSSSAPPKPLHRTPVVKGSDAPPVQASDYSPAKLAGRPAQEQSGDVVDEQVCMPAAGADEPGTPQSPIGDTRTAKQAEDESRTAAEQHPGRSVKPGASTPAASGIAREGDPSDDRWV